MNKVILLGRLVRDPEVKASQNGKIFAQFCIAVDRPYVKGKDREADFINCVAFNKAGEFIGNYFNKGQRILIEDGNLRVTSFEKNGEKRFTTNVVANKVAFVDKAEKKAVSTEPMKSFGTEVGYDDEIPF
ncbi:single-stranded DNA-binding protein [Acidaminococcus sp. LBK-2]|uniref:single-stranded DNA-binding protein n=1 Tax=Acidaminococcus sp. LBK-2 TaxID=3456956 RepID=UPI003FA4B480